MRIESNSAYQVFLKQVIKALISIIEERDVFIKGHSERVASNCIFFAKKLSLPKKDLDSIYLAGMLHDIGMFYVPLEIIHKPGDLMEEEMSIIRQHPVIAVDFLSQISIFHDAVPFIRHHHEHIDGSGYPDGLKGDEIPLGAKILCLMDSYDAMTSSRPHRPALGTKEALEEIVRTAGTKYEKSLIKDFVNFIASSAAPSVKDDETAGPARKAVLDIAKKFQKGDIDLPVLPTIVKQVRQAIDAPNSTAESIAKVLETDAAITIRLISVANSAIYRGIEKILSVRQAITRLGMKEMQNIVIAVTNRSLYETDNKEFMGLMEKLWQHSLACAYCARLIAEHLRIPDNEKYFIFGLLHDIGKTLLLQTISRTGHKDSLSDKDFDLSEIIASIHDTHAYLGSLILERWGFPDECIKVARFHENTRFDDTTPLSVKIVHVANLLTRTIGFSVFSNDNPDPTSINSEELLGVEPDSLKTIGEEAIKLMHLSMSVF
ncbi:MAG TPA: HDOD domain-containing protein [Deltaproteobacteria bacterium]|nr:HDOD domain-containing protein [Deltaproteobacteria bacterium]